MKGQYEQQCNAAALKELKVPVIKSLKSKHLDKVRDWAIKKTQPITVDYPDVTERVIEKILADHFRNLIPKVATLGDKPYSIKKLKKLTLVKIINKVSA